MKENLKTIIALLLIICSIVLINVGIMNGQVQEVLRKAVNICMECIGIG